MSLKYTRLAGNMHYDWYVRIFTQLYLITVAAIVHVFLRLTATVVWHAIDAYVKLVR